MSVKQLRPYQERLFNAVRYAYMDGKRRIIIQLPTGGGKSILFSKFISGANDKQKGVLFLVHRRELIKQASDHLSNEDVSHGIIMANVLPDKMQRTQLASVQTLWSRCFKRGLIPVPNAELVVIDECHHATSKTFEEILKYYNHALVIGVTATPTRQDGKPLGDYFEYMVLADDHDCGVRSLMDQGYLCEARYMVPSVPDLEGVMVRRGDYVENQLSEVMDKAKLVGNIIEHYKKYAGNRKAIVFAVNVAHSEHIVNEFNRAGIRAAHIDGKTKLIKREKIIEQYTNGEFQVLSNCEVFTEGFDMPDVDAVILARPTKSLRMYLQMVGRGLRTKPGGGDCMILDHSGNVLRHGPVDQEHEWSLDEEVKPRVEKKTEKKTEKGKKEKEYICGTCGAVFSGTSLCPLCGSELPRTAIDVDTARGELVGIEPKKKEKAEKWTMAQKREWWSMFLEYARRKGYQRGWASHKYKEKFKVWPRGVDGDQFHGEFPQEFRNYIKYLAIKQAKSRA